MKLNGRLKNSGSWITWIEYCWYRFQCFHQSKPFIALSFLVRLVFKMFDAYVWWINRFLILSIYNFYSYISEMFSFAHEKTVVFFYTSIVWMTIHYTALKTSWRRLSSTASEDVLIKTNMFTLALLLQDVFKTFWSRPIYSSWPNVLKTPSRHFQDVFKTFCKDVLKKFCEDVFKTSSRRLAKISSRHFQDVSSS